MNPNQIAAEAARKLMIDRPYIGAGITEDELADAFQAAMSKALIEQRNYFWRKEAASRAAQAGEE